MGLVDIADLIYVRSGHHVERQERLGTRPEDAPPAVLFGAREGRIALANRRKDPFLLFAALHRQLGYPEIPPRKPIDQTPEITAALLRRMERVETRLKLLEEEQRGGIDISRFTAPPSPPTGAERPSGRTEPTRRRRRAGRLSRLRLRRRRGWFRNSASGFLGRGPGSADGPVTSVIPAAGLVLADPR